MLTRMNPNVRLLLAGLLLAVALAFYFFGERLLDTAEAPDPPAPTSSAFVRTVEA